MDEQAQRTIENARKVLPGMNVVPTVSCTFPYQYLGDWFTLTPMALPLASVQLKIMPADTADRGGQYRSLLIGETLIDNPVLTVAYDGRAMTTVSSPATLRAYLDGLTPAYAMERMGEGWGAPHQDPSVPDARRVMESFLVTLGQKPN